MVQLLATTTRDGKPLLSCPKCGPSQVFTVTTQRTKKDKKTGEKVKVGMREVKWMCKCGETLKTFRLDKYGNAKEYVPKTRKSKGKDAQPRKENPFANG